MLRVAKELDCDALAEISKRNVQPSWSAQDFLDAIHNPQAKVFLWEEEKVCGYGVLYFAADEGEIPSIAVDLEFRRRGFAQKIFAAMEEFAKEEKLRRIFLEVRESNEGAIAFYKRNDFSEVGRRPKFYHDPTEDGLILERNLTC